MSIMSNFDVNTPKEIVSKRFEMIQVREKGEKVNNILAKYNISKPVFYKFHNRYNQYGAQGLYNLSKAPHNHGMKISTEDEEKIITLHKEYPYFSSYELNELMGLNPRTIQRIYKRNNLVKAYKPKKEKKEILERLKKEILKRKREKRLRKKS